MALYPYAFFTVFLEYTYYLPACISQDTYNYMSCFLNFLSENSAYVLNFLLPYFLPYFRPLLTHPVPDSEKTCSSFNVVGIDLLFLCYIMTHLETLSIH